ncbi:hypothetical protein ACS0TY_002683 [Phlomoides rotata]
MYFFYVVPTSPRLNALDATPQCSARLQTNVLGSGEATSAHICSSSNLEETEHQASKPDVSGQPGTSGVKDGEISLRPQKGPKQVGTNVAGEKSCWFFNNTWENLLKGMEFRP